MDLYAFAEGPLVWISFAVFLLGTLIKIIMLFQGSAKVDKVFYEHFSWKWVIASWSKWLLPANKDLAKNPLFCIAGYLFHFCLILVPIFCLPHVIMWETSSFGLSFISLSESLSDWLTIVFLVCGVYLIARRMFDPDAKILTTAGDYFLLVVTILPFLTGYFSAHASFGVESVLGRNMQLIHILSGELMLIIIPFTKLSHFILFFFSRATAAVEFGRRGYSI